MPSKYLVVGGVAGGASTAARLRRLSEDDEIIMFEKGPHVSFSNCSLPYYLSGTVANVDDLVLMCPEKFRSQYNIDARVNNEVIAIDREKKEVEVKNLESGETYRENYDKLVLSPGARPIVPPIPGIEKANIHTVRNVVDIDRLQQDIEKTRPSRITVIGGGFIGIEVVENLIEAGHTVSLVEAAPQVLSQFDTDMAQILHKELIDHDVDLVVNDRVTAFDTNKVMLESGREIETEIIVMGIGVTPDSALAKAAGLKIGSTGAIRVDHNYRTSDPDIYAVGDAIQVYNPILRDYYTLALAGPAQRQARAVANHIHNIPVDYHGYIGSSVVKVFDYNAASTGLNERMLQNTSIEYDSVKIVPKDKVGIMPDAEELHFKILFEVPTGRIIGAQAIGRGNVDKRIDVIAATITAKGTVDHLKDLELCYAPPFGTAKDVVNMAGYVASNILHETFKQVQITEIRSLVEKGAFILDVREQEEWDVGHIKVAKHIPLSELRQRIDEIPRDQPVYVHCRSGQRSYNAVLALQYRGYTEVYNVAGGYIGLCFHEYFHDRMTGREPIVTEYDFT
ncbi:FAD-dependent oxidoreductase [Thiolapillus brandeum]|uniref:Pyridine nucleotide-disulphide oxidoreductase family protein n=1 Tax=Thiolapillus brandeum TaxID=1076588 RepID=A0A7U6GK21_9GAMM|nr:FAD-dependent oxidoreductase [Thiolapillus brandeum]BAO45086.1 pyridine nucleotide-disulphide oxidoreductase family protein [Thiolapillus brandeum]